ncbi:MAG: MotA/TolQ/ExbB proton channel family protein [Myxococcota bacterium]|nr:MotA/TolQ/ExbB proton channel family protein [Myxococcota bacterium]
MQILGLALLVFVVAYGFGGERDATTVSAFDPHAFIVVMGGSLSAILVMSSATTTFRTFAALRELIPGLGVMKKTNESMEAERTQFQKLWLDGNRSQAVALAEGSAHPVTQRMLQLVLSRAPKEGVKAAFTELQHAEMSRHQPAVGNWELLAKLAPSMGMVGTITGMIQLFKTMGDADTDLGASISLALLATLYGVAFGAGVAGPIGHFLRNHLDERLGVLERCEQTALELIAWSGREP